MWEAGAIVAPILSPETRMRREVSFTLRPLYYRENKIPGFREDVNLSYLSRIERLRGWPSCSLFTNFLKFMYSQFNIQQSLRSAHTVYLCVLCGSENKPLLFPYTALTDWFYKRDLTLYNPAVTIRTNKFNIQ